MRVPLHTSPSHPPLLLHAAPLTSFTWPHSPLASISRFTSPHRPQDCNSLRLEQYDLWLFCGMEDPLLVLRWTLCKTHNPQTSDQHVFERAAPARPRSKSRARGQFRAPARPPALVPPACSPASWPALPAQLAFGASGAASARASIRTRTACRKNLLCLKPCRNPCWNSPRQTKH